MRDGRAVTPAHQTPSRRNAELFEQIPQFADSQIQSCPDDLQLFDGIGVAAVPAEACPEVCCQDAGGQSLHDLVVNDARQAVSRVLT
jgi:hypothetical protein